MADKNNPATEEAKATKKAEAAEAADDTENTEDAEAKNAEDTAPAEENPAAALEARVKELEKELAAANDKYLRMIAEYDNFRKRTAKEKENTYTEAVADTVQTVLGIGDNLARASAFTDPESVSKGIAMMQKGFEETLGKLGVTEIESLGKTFDPALHSAVMHVDDETKGEGEIVEVFQKGYTKGDRVIRYAMVKVAN